MAGPTVDTLNLLIECRVASSIIIASLLHVILIAVFADLNIPMNKRFDEKSATGTAHSKLRVLTAILKRTNMNLKRRGPSFEITAKQKPSK